MKQAYLKRITDLNQAHEALQVPIANLVKCFGPAGRPSPLLGNLELAFKAKAMLTLPHDLILFAC